MTKRTSALSTHCVLCAVLAVLVCGVVALGQQVGQTQYDRGTPPQLVAGLSGVGSYSGTEFGTVNLANGALNISIPVGQVGGRGFWLPLTINYSSKVWALQGGTDAVDINTQRTTVSAVYGWNSYDYDIFNRIAPGWTFGGVPALKAQGVLTGPVTGQTCAWTFALTKLAVIMPDKGEIQFRDDVFDGEPQYAINDGTCRARDADRGPGWHATDGSGMIFLSDPGTVGVARGDLSGTVITADGMMYHFINVSYPGGGILQNDRDIHNLARCDRITDRNGNYIQITYSGSPSPYREVDFTDQLGRVTTIRRINNSPLPPNLLITLPGYNSTTYGQSRQIQVNLAQINQVYRSDQFTMNPVYSGAYSPGINNWAEGLPPNSIFLFPHSEGVLSAEIDNQAVVSQIILPDGRIIGFKYNQFGEVAEIDTPFTDTASAGSIQYDYNGVPLPNLPSGNTPLTETHAQMNSIPISEGIDRAVTKKKTYIGGVREGEWTYTYAPQTPSNSSITCPNTTTQPGCTEVFCTDVKNNKLLLHQRHFFLPGGTYFAGPDLYGKSGSGYTIWSSSLELRTETFDTNGTSVLQASETCWTQRAPIQWTGTYTTTAEQVENDNRVSETRHYLDDGSMSKVDTFYDDNGPGGNAGARANNPITVDEYDFPSGTTIKRHTVTSYQYYLNVHIHLLRLPVVRSVYDVPNGTLFSQTTYEYDNYTAEQQPPINHQPLQDYTTVTNHDPGYPASYLTRGNPTQITQLGVPTAITYPRYDTLGNLVSIKDPNGNVTTISFSDDFGNGSSPGSGTSSNTYALPTKITSPPINNVSQTAQSQYDFSTGLLTGFKDRNGIITQTIYDDPFDRPTLTKSALGVAAVEAHTAMYYAGAGPNPFGVTLTNADVLTARDQAVKDDGHLRSWTHTDGFGRSTQTSMHDDTPSDIHVTTVYDALSRKIQVSNPFRTETPVYTTTAYDMVGRVSTVTATDGAVTTATYAGPVVTATDPAPKVRSSKVDGLGRMIQVTEDPNGLAYVTNYTYDPLDDLTQVQQVGQSPAPTQTRTFTFDGLKRLQSATNPENGQITYQYDNNGNLKTKTEVNANVVTNYSYDVLNRMTDRSYSVTSPFATTPAVKYHYDDTTAGNYGIGRLASVDTGGVQTYAYSKYDALGRVLQSTQTTGGTQYGLTYTYDLAGELTSELYPSGTKIVPAYDQAGRVSGVTRTLPTNKPYASSLSYSPHGAVTSMTLGNTLIEQTTYNNRLQPTLIQLGVSTANPQSVLGLSYTYNTSGHNDNNGNVLTQTITANSGATTIGVQSYSYDGANRLSGATETPNGTPPITWTQTYDYDQFGNRAVRNGSYIPGGNLTPTSNSTADLPNLFDQTTNRIRPLTGFGYDNAGNLTADPNPASMVYDAENHQTSYTKSGVTTIYAYDGEMRRVQKTGGSTTTFVYNVFGQLIAEYGGPATNGGTSYLTNDHLGSTRVVTTSINNQPSVVARHDYLPFGEELPAGGTRTFNLGYVTTDDTRQRFTGKERDNESGLDYFGARYCSAAQGRFASPDSVAGKPGNPQSLNLYAYTGGNPLHYVDPSGHLFGAAVGKAYLEAPARNVEIGGLEGGTGDDQQNLAEEHGGLGAAFDPEVLMTLYSELIKLQEAEEVQRHEPVMKDEPAAPSEPAPGAGQQVTQPTTGQGTAAAMRLIPKLQAQFDLLTLEEAIQEGNRLGFIMDLETGKIHNHYEAPGAFDPGHKYYPPDPLAPSQGNSGRSAPTPCDPVPRGCWYPALENPASDPKKWPEPLVRAPKSPSWIYYADPKKAPLVGPPAPRQ